jgi:hypothetical protein
MNRNDPLDAILARLDTLDARLDAAQRPLLSVREAGDLLGLGRDATLRFCKVHGVLVNVGGERGLRVLREDLMAALRSAPVGGKPRSRAGASRTRTTRSRRAANPANLGDYDDDLADPEGTVVWNPAFG